MFVAAQPLVLFAVDRIVVVDADNSWAASAAALLDELCAALPSAWEQLEHIGSTSVPGLAAKPVVDLMAATPDLAHVVAAEGDALSPLGYLRLETGMTGRLFYRREAGVGPASSVAVHFHVVPSEGWATQNERLFRDHLLDHPEDAARYGELKRRLADEFDDPLAYTRAKTALIQEMVDRARSDRGLPAANVWED